MRVNCARDAFPIHEIFLCIYWNLNGSFTIFVSHGFYFSSYWIGTEIAFYFKGIFLGRKKLIEKLFKWSCIKKRS